MQKILFFFFSLLSHSLLCAQVSDSLQNQAPHLEMGLSVGNMLKMDIYQKLWLHQNRLQSWQVGWRWKTPSQQQDPFARAYHYPEWALQLSIGNFREVKMQKYPHPFWEQLQTVHYASDMGYLFSLYGQFSRPLWHHHKWTAGYALEEGLSWNTRPYNSYDNVDNELTGSALLIHFGASAWLSYQFAPRWTVRGDLAFRHVSNGATDRPNKGANWLAPTLTLQYALPTREKTTPSAIHFLHQPLFDQQQIPRYWYTEFSGSIGLKTLLEDWLVTQYQTAPDAHNYRTEHFQRYPIYSLQTAFMRRYATQWATGLGMDLFYLGYASQLRTYAFNQNAAVSPWSLGLALKHEAFYHRWAMSIQLGYYLLRHTGQWSKGQETPYYERVALRYYFPLSFAARPRSLFLGLGIKAHSTKADFTELTLGYTF